MNFEEEEVERYDRYLNELKKEIMIESADIIEEEMGPGNHILDIWQIDVRKGNNDELWMFHWSIEPRNILGMKLWMSYHTWIKKEMAKIRDQKIDLLLALRDCEAILSSRSSPLDDPGQFGDEDEE